MSERVYGISRRFVRHVRRQRLDVRTINAERLADPGTRLLAVTHLSHLEPAVVSEFLDRPIYWMSRREFFQNPFAGALLRINLAFPVDRAGVSVSAIRRGIEHVNARRTVGIFPEGGVATGANSVLRGGPIRGGVCLISQRSGVPILPVAVYGTQALNTVRPWLPFQPKMPVLIACGDPVEPIAGDGRPGSRRRARAEMMDQLTSAFRRVHDRVTDARLIPSPDLD